MLRAPALHCGYEDIRTAIAGENNAKAGGAQMKLRPYSHDQSEFKDLAQTWGWKMITVHECIYP
jgi:putative endonuclease